MSKEKRIIARVDDTRIKEINKYKIKAKEQGTKLNNTDFIIRAIDKLLETGFKEDEELKREIQEMEKKIIRIIVGIDEVDLDNEVYFYKLKEFIERIKNSI